MEYNELGYLAQAKKTDFEQAARDWDLAKSARPEPRTSDPYTVRWMFGAFRRWREARQPPYVRGHGYRELYPGSYGTPKSTR
jgi:hypothetical protein